MELDQRLELRPCGPLPDRLRGAARRMAPPRARVALAPAREPRRELVRARVLAGRIRAAAAPRLRRQARAEALLQPAQLREVRIGAGAPHQRLRLVAGRIELAVDGQRAQARGG